MSESRIHNVAVKVTESEKRAVRGLAAIEGIGESELLRRMGVGEVVERFERIVQAQLVAPGQ